MIKLADYLPPLSEPFIGCEIESLHHCYHNDWKRFNTFISDLGGVVCHFESRFLVSGKASYDEICALAASLGVTVIEGLREDLPEGKGNSYHSILEFAGSIEEYSPFFIDKDASYKTVFDILCDSNQVFKETADYLNCLSHATQLKLHGRGFSYTAEHSQTAAVTAISSTHALISQVATRPEFRGRGLCSIVLKILCKDLSQQGLTPFVISEDVAMDKFYEKLGFVHQNEKAVIQLDKENTNGF